MAKLIGLLLILTAALSGCYGTSSAPALKSSGKIAPDFMRIDARLDFARTNQVLTQVRDNLVQLSGNRSQKNYLIRYSFNSQETTALNLRSLSFRRVDYKGCNGKPSINHYLQESGSMTDISLGKNVELRPNTDYVYILEIRTDCQYYEGEILTTVWAGDKNIDPKFDYVCRGSAGQLVHFIQTNAATIHGFAQKHRFKEQFIGSTSFCGVQLPNKAQSCGISTEGAAQDEPNFSSANCSEKVESTLYEWNAHFYPEFASADIKCEVNGVQSYQGEFTDCKSMIVDYKQFSNLE